jgi:hypothetical protein
MPPAQLPMDFDGLVLSGAPQAESIAIALNKNKKGQPSQRGYRLVTTRVGNLLFAQMAPNLKRELQIDVPPSRALPRENTLRSGDFKNSTSFTRNLLQRAEPMIRPKCKVSLSINHNAAIKAELSQYLGLFASALCEI